MNRLTVSRKLLRLSLFARFALWYNIVGSVVLAVLGLAAFIFDRLAFSPIMQGAGLMILGVPLFWWVEKYSLKKYRDGAGP